MGEKCQKTQDEQSKIENRFRGMAYENNLTIDNSTFAFVQLSHPAFNFSNMMTK